jgi:hypothetical protein
MSPAQANPAETKEVSAPDTATPSNMRLYTHAVQRGGEILAQEGSKAAAAREIFTMLQNEHRDVVLKAFIEGAQCTVKGAPTYFYNISRKARRVAKTDATEQE